MENTFNFFAFFIGCIFTILAIKRILKQEEYVAPIVYIAFFLIFILPLGIDFWNSSTANYGIFYSITNAVKDPNVIYIYALFTIYFSFTFYFLTKETKKNQPDNKISHLVFFYNNWKIVFHIIIVIPIILVFFFPEREKFLIYGYIGLRDFSKEVLPQLNSIYLAANFSVITIFIMVLIKGKVSSIIPYIPILLFDIWINGKRNIIVLLLLFLIYTIYIDKTIKKTSKFIIFVGVFIVMITYFNYYKTIKPEINNDNSFRIEYFRDHTVKFAIFKELNPSQGQILEYKGQSLLFYLTFPIPREYWENKPMPYAQYLTSAALNIPPNFNGWGITNSIFDELICNLGIWCILLFPFLISRIIKIGGYRNNRISNIFTILIICLLFSVEITAYLPIYILYVIYNVYIRKKNKNKSHFKDIQSA